MFEHIDELAEADHVDGLHCAFKDWAAWSRYSGPRRSEWCQESQTYQRADAGEDDEAKAIIAADIHFFDKHGREITLDCDFSRVAYAEVEWRFQKNGMNGEKIKYYVNLLSQKMVPSLRTLAHHASSSALGHTSPRANRPVHRRKRRTPIHRRYRCAYYLTRSCSRQTRHQKRGDSIKMEHSFSSSHSGERASSLRLRFALHPISTAMEIRCFHEVSAAHHPCRAKAHSDHGLERRKSSASQVEPDQSQRKNAKAQGVPQPRRRRHLVGKQILRSSRVKPLSPRSNPRRIPTCIPASWYQCHTP